MTGIRGTLEPFREILDGLGVVDDYVPSAVQAVRGRLEETTSAGTSPSGEKWSARKKDGGRPLENAMGAIDVRAAGRNVIIELRGHHVFQHYGAADLPIREIIPKEVAETLGNAIRRGVVAPFEAKTQAGKRGYAATRARGLNPRDGRGS